jgi:hypothetical protein
MDSELVMKRYEGSILPGGNVGEVVRKIRSFL